MLNDAKICWYGPWPHGIERHLWLYLEPLDRTERKPLDVLRVYDPIEGPRMIRRADVENYIAVHGVQEALWQPGDVPDDYAGRTGMEVAMGRIRALGGGVYIEPGQLPGQEILAVVIDTPGLSGMPEYSSVGQLVVERSPDGSATVDTSGLEMIVSDLVARTSAPYSI